MTPSELAQQSRQAALAALALDHSNVLAQALRDCAVELERQIAMAIKLEARVHHLIKDKEEGR